MDIDTAYRIIRVRMWEKGHTFPEIDMMNLADFGDVLAYWNEKNRAERKQAKSNIKGGKN